jgi:hypothetical protein
MERHSFNMHGIQNNLISSQLPNNNLNKPPGVMHTQMTNKENSLYEMLKDNSEINWKAKVLSELQAIRNILVNISLSRRL